VDSLHASRPIYVDLYRRGRWIAGRTSRLREGRAAVRLPGTSGGLVLLQASTAPIDVGRAFSAHHLYLEEAGTDRDEILRVLATALRDADLDRPYAEALLADRHLLRSARDGELERTAAFLLSRFDRGYYSPERLVSSEQVRSAELLAFQRAYKLRISLAIGLLGLVVTLLVAYGFAVSAWRARARRQEWDAATGASEDELYVTSMGRPKGLDRFRVVVQLVLMVGVVAVGFLLLAVLVSVMSWQG
jgi:hypothetical protein